jgi:methyltransferase (TIGR00027 family)
MLVAEWRHVQSIHEKPELRNPDTLVRYFLPAFRRWRCTWVGKKRLAVLRADPFYYYLVARTKYYDRVFRDAISAEVQSIINIGCGTDTRSYRFEDLLTRQGIKVLECDRSEDISQKERTTRRRRISYHVAYVAVDLNASAWPDLDGWLLQECGTKALVLMEGVSPYIDSDAFCHFLRFLAMKLPAGSLVAYDFKLRGVDDDFGRVGPARELFRLASEPRYLAGFHEALGFQLEHMERSHELEMRLLPDHARAVGSLFMEDGLVQLSVGQNGRQLVPSTMQEPVDEGA